MAKRILKKKLLTTILVLIFFGLLMVWNPTNIFSPVRSFFETVLLPIEKISMKTASSLDDFISFFRNIGDLKKENEHLNRENVKLTAQLAQFKDTQEENNILREKLGLRPKDFNTISAEVIGFDPDAQGSWIIINKGKRHGIAEDMTIIADSGILVGKIDEVYLLSARVMLLSHPESVVNATVPQTDAKGVVEGEYGIGIIFDMALQTEDIEPGDTIITSGIGGSMPRGLLIGTIGEVVSGQKELFQKTTVNTPLKIPKLRVVFAISQK